MAIIGEGPSLGLALTAALTAGKPEPVTIEDVLGTYGSNSAAARDLAGLPSTGPLPRRGAAERRRYDSAMRRVQRYGSTGAERRRPKGKNLADLRRRGTVNLAGPQLAKAREAGLGVRVTMVYRISQTTYTKDLPGGAKWQRLGPRDIRSALGLWAAGDVEGAGAELESLFNEKYWVMRPDASGKMVSNIAGGDVQLDGEDEDGTPLGVTYAWVMIGHP